MPFLNLAECERAIALMVRGPWSRAPKVPHSPASGPSSHDSQRRFGDEFRGHELRSRQARRAHAPLTSPGIPRESPSLCYYLSRSCVIKQLTETLHLFTKQLAQFNHS